jgi:putative heme degradation protein
VEEGTSTAWVTERNAYCGLITTVIFKDQNDLYGVWFTDRDPGEPEDHLWRTVLLETLFLDWNNSVDSFYTGGLSEREAERAAK